MNKVALVTGGTGGIGTAICRALADQGRHVVAGYNRGGDDSAARAWQKSQAEAGYEFGISYGDVSNFESAKAMVKDIEERFGKITVCVNNAGITRDGTLKKMQPVDWEAVLTTNLDSVFNVSKAVLDGMLEEQFGRIVCISSINGSKGQFGQTNYAASKAGMVGFVKSLALETARKGVTVNSISPGYVATPMVKAMADDVVASIVAQIPVQRLAEPEEIARAVAFLTADEAGFITGSNLAVNGGQYML